MSIADKLNYLITTKGLLKDNINKINNVLDDNSTFRSYPQELFNGYLDILNNGTDTLWSNLEKVSASGEEATLENVETAPIKMVLNGNTIQDGTPTPDTPVEVKVVTGENVVSVSGENLFDEETELGRLQSSPSSPNFGGEVASTTQLRAKDYIQVKPNTTYFCYFGSTVSGAQVFVFAYDENYNAITSYGYKTFTNTTITTPEGARYIRFYMNAQYGTTYNNDICIVEGTSTDYTPYSKTDYPINLGDIELCKINTYNDFPFKAINGNEYYDTLTDEQKNALNYGSWYVHKAIGKKIVTSSEILGQTDSYSNVIYYKFNKNTDSINYNNYNSMVAFYTHAKISNSFNFDSLSQVSTINSLAENTRYWVGFPKGTTLTQAKEKLVGSVLYYILKTPTEEEITDTTLISQLEAIYKAKSVKDKTYITQTNDELPFILDVEAIKEYEVN